LGKREIGRQQSSRSHQQNSEGFHRSSDEPSSFNHFMKSLSSQPFSYGLPVALVQSLTDLIFGRVATRCR
jgi:hypothetical protein